MKKTFLAIIMAFALVIGNMAFPVISAIADDTTVAEEEMETDDGSSILIVTAVVEDEQVTVTWALPEGSGVAGGSIKYTYDTDMLALSSWVNGSTLGSKGSIVANTANGNANISFASSTEYEDACVLGVGTFDLLDGTFDASYFTCTAYKLVNVDSIEIETLDTVNPVIEVAYIESTDPGETDDPDESDDSEESDGSILIVSAVVEDDQVTVTWAFPEGSGVAGASVKYTYDTDKLAFSSWVDGSTPDGAGIITVNTTAEGKVNISSASTTDYDEAYVLGIGIFDLLDETFDASYFTCVGYSVASSVSGVIEDIDTVTPVMEVSYVESTDPDESEESEPILMVKAVVDGDQVTVTWAMPENSEVAGGSIKYTYDTDKLALSSWIDGSIPTDDGTIIVNTTTEGKVNISFASSTAPEEGYVLGIGVFDLVDETFDGSYFTCTAYSVADETASVIQTLDDVTPVITVTRVGGSIMVVDAVVQGDQVTVTWSIPANSGVAGGKIAYTYDADKMALSSFEKGTIESGYIVPNTTVEGEIIVSFASTYNNVDELIIGTGVFSLTDGTFDSSYLTCTVYQISDEEAVDYIETLDEVIPEVTVTYIPVTNGVCGDNLTWNLEEDGTLTISGTGEMYDYADGEQPWCESVDSIKAVVIEEGATTVGEYAFCDCQNLTSISLPDSLTSISTGALSNCSNLLTIIVSQNTGMDTDCGFGLAGETIVNAVIYGYSGSSAEAYATANNVTFISMSEEKVISDVTADLSTVVDANGDALSEEAEIVEDDVFVGEYFDTEEGYEFLSDVVAPLNNGEKTISEAIDGAVSADSEEAFDLTNYELMSSITDIRVMIADQVVEGVKNVQVSFEVPGLEEGMEIAVVHYDTTTGVWEVYDNLSIEGTTVTVTLSSLSPVGIIYKDIKYTLGDVNEDGEIDYLDAMNVLRYDAELVDLEEAQLLAGDVNLDGAVDSLDAILILRYDADLIDSFGQQ